MTDTSPGQHRPRRRDVLIGAGGLGAAGAVVAACGRSERGDATATGPAPSTTAAGDALVLATTDVPVGGGIVLPEGATVVTQPQAGVFKAFSAICTHRQCMVSSVSDGTIDCPCHGSRFDITDGSVVHGPANEPLPAKSVTVVGDTVRVS